MRGFATWGAGDWVTLGIGVFALAGGLAMVLFGPAIARRQARKDGRIDADGDLYYEDNNDPGTYVRGGLVTAAIGFGYTLWRLSAGGGVMSGRAPSSPFVTPGLAGMKMIQIIAIIGVITGFIGGFGMLFAKGPPENRSRMRRQAIISFVAGTTCLVLLATRLL